MQHFFFYCSKVRVFWDQVTVMVMLNSQGITFRPFDIKDIVFGFLDTLTCDSDCMLLNYIILESKYLIFIVPNSIRLICLLNYFQFRKNQKHVSNRTFSS